MTFDPREPPVCCVCGEEILHYPNLIGGDVTRPECDKCFMKRIDPVHEPWLDDPFEFEAWKESQGGSD